jgi:hypothetical protein
MLANPSERTFAGHAVKTGTQGHAVKTGTQCHAVKAAQENLPTKQWLRTPEDQLDLRRAVTTER